MREIAKILRSKHRDLGSSLEQMVKGEFRKLDVFGNGMLRADEIGVALQGLGFRKQSNGSASGLKFFIDRGGNVDFNGESFISFLEEVHFNFFSQYVFFLSDSIGK